MKKKVQVISINHSEGVIFKPHDERRMSWLLVKESLKKVISKRHDRQHLYFTSDEEIKEGVNTYYLDSYTNKVKSSGGAEYGPNQDVIIATTDKSVMDDIRTLNTSGNLTVYPKLYPKVPQSFLDKFVKSEGKIKEVELDYDLVVAGVPNIYDLRVTEDNEVIINLIEEITYTQEQFDANYNKGFNDGLDNA